MSALLAIYFTGFLLCILLGFFTPSSGGTSIDDEMHLGMAMIFGLLWPALVILAPVLWLVDIVHSAWKRRRS